MRISWGLFWFVLSTVSTINGSFLIFTTIFNSGCLRMLAAVAMAAGFRRMLRVRLIFEPVCIDFGSMLLLQIVSVFLGEKWAVMVALGLNALTVSAACLLFKPTPHVGLWESVVSVALVNGQWIIVWFVLYGPAADHQFDLMTPYVAGFLCLNNSMMMFMHYLLSFEQHKPNTKAQITGIRSVVPLVHRQQGGLPFR